MHKMPSHLQWAPSEADAETVEADADAYSGRTSDAVDRQFRSMSFEQLLHLPAALQAGLDANGFVHPSPVQREALPVAKLGLDLLVQAKSGTGKTLVFALASLHMVDAAVLAPQALVLAPTREIAVQGARVLRDLSAPAMAHVHVHTFIGGTDVAQDKAKLRGGCHVAVGTPGRVRQLIDEGHLQADKIRLLSLDEADKLMESSFLADVTWIFNKLPGHKQVLALSATYPPALARIVSQYMKNATHVRPAEKDQVLLGMMQYAIKVKSHPVSMHQVNYKWRSLIALLENVSFHQCLVFSNYSERARALCQRAQSMGWPALYISAAMDQSARLEAVGKLRRFECRLLFSTDLTARGIDAEHVNLVINVDVPWDSSTYLHRMGRAGRFGTAGLVVTLAADGEEHELLRKIVYRTGSRVHALPDQSQVPSKRTEAAELAYAEEVGRYELWEREKNAQRLPLVEPLECSGEPELNNNYNKNKSNQELTKTKKMGKKKKQQTEASSGRTSPAERVDASIKSSETMPNGQSAGKSCLNRQLVEDILHGNPSEFQETEVLGLVRLAKMSFEQALDFTRCGLEEHQVKAEESHLSKTLSSPAAPSELNSADGSLFQMLVPPAEGSASPNEAGRQSSSRTNSELFDGAGRTKPEATEPRIGHFDVKEQRQSPGGKTKKRGTKKKSAPEPAVPDDDDYVDITKAWVPVDSPVLTRKPAPRKPKAGKVAASNRVWPRYEELSLPVPMPVPASRPEVPASMSMPAPTMSSTMKMPMSAPGQSFEADGRAHFGPSPNASGIGQSAGAAGQAHFGPTPNASGSSQLIAAAGQAHFGPSPNASGCSQPIVAADPTQPWSAPNASTNPLLDQAIALLTNPNGAPLLVPPHPETLYDGKVTALPLPHPDPTRLVPPDWSTRQDTAWFAQWCREISENKKFIEDMSFARKLGQLGGGKY